MANYSLVIDSKFKPFSYQELLAPALMATQAHQAIEEEYGNLETKASIWDKMANEQTDPKAHAQYQRYADDLREQADQLSKYGLNPYSRRSMLNMRSRYAKEITPIETAYKKRESDIAAQKEALIKDPTHFFNRKAAEVSLDEYIDNQSLDVLSDNYSGALLTQQVGQAAANLKQTLMKKGALTALGLPYQYERMLQYGATVDDVVKAMSKDPKALPILTKLVDDVMESSGIRKWSSMNGDYANNEMYRRAEAYAMSGLYNAIGTTKIDNFTDSFSMQDALNARQHARQVAEKKRQEAVAAAQAAGLQARLNPLPLRNTAKVSAANKEIDRYMKAGYFTKDSNGHYKITAKGMAELRRTTQQEVRGSSSNWALNLSGDPMISADTRPITSYKTVRTPFYNFMTKLNGGKSFLKDNGTVMEGWGPNRIGNLFGSYVARNQEGSFDTYHSTEYDRQLSSSYGKEVATQFWGNSGTKGGKHVLQGVSFDGKNGWKDTKTYTTEDLAGYHVSNIRYSRYGNTAILSKDGADPVRVRIPRGINLGSETNVATALSNADDWLTIRDKGYLPKVNGNKFVRDRNGNIQFTSTPLTQDDLTVLNTRLNSALDDMNLYGAQLVVPSVTKNEEITPFNF